MKCPHCQTELDNGYVPIQDPIYGGLKLKERANTSSDQVQAAVCPHCGYVHLFIQAF